MADEEIDDDAGIRQEAWGKDVLAGQAGSQKLLKSRSSNSIAAASEKEQLGCSYIPRLIKALFKIISYFPDSSGFSSHSSMTREDLESMKSELRNRIFNCRSRIKLRPISPYESALFDDSLLEFISKKQKR